MLSNLFKRSSSQTTIEEIHRPCSSKVHCLYVLMCVCIVCKDMVDRIYSNLRRWEWDENQTSVYTHTCAHTHTCLNCKIVPPVPYPEKPWINIVITRCYIAKLVDFAEFTLHFETLSYGNYKIYYQTRFVGQIASMRFCAHAFLTTELLGTVAYKSRWVKRLKRQTLQLHISIKSEVDTLTENNDF